MPHPTFRTLALPRARSARPIPTLFLALTLAAPATALAAGGNIVWSRPFTAPEGAAAPATASDGALYWAANGLLHKADSQGQVLWHRASATTFTLGPGNRVYVAGTTESTPAAFAIRAITTDNQLLWEYTDLAGIQGFVGGPDIGPDGNIYATADGPTDGPGTFSLTPAGAFRWNVSDFGNIAGTPPSHLVFSAQNVYKAENITPTQSGLYEGLVAMRLDSGSISWMWNYAVPGAGPGRQPRVNPITGEVNTSQWFGNDVRSYRTDGSIAWTYVAQQFGIGLTEIDVGPDGNIYFGNGNRDVISLSASGQFRWNASQVVPGSAQGAYTTPPAVSPDGQTVVFATSACNGYTCPGSVVALNTATGTVRWSVALPLESAGVPSVYQSPTFSPDSSLVYIAATTSATTSRLYALCVSGGCAVPCYANCDTSTAPPILNANDFQCFLNRFAAGDPAANCDGSTAAPVLNANDFQCFLNTFAAGCR